MPNRKSSTKKSHQVLINKAVASLKRLEESLDIDPAMLPEERKRLRGYSTVPTMAITLAANVVKQNPDRFGEFSAADMSGAVDFETQMAPLAVQARAFANHLDKAIQKQRAPAAKSTLALYAIVKGLGRVQANETFRDHADNLHALMKRGRKSTRKKGATASAPADTAAQQPAATSTTTSGASAVKPS